MKEGNLHSEASVGAGNATVPTEAVPTYIEDTPVFGLIDRGVGVEVDGTLGSGTGATWPFEAVQALWLLRIAGILAVAPLEVVPDHDCWGHTWGSPLEVGPGLQGCWLACGIMLTRECGRDVMSAR